MFVLFLQTSKRTKGQSRRSSERFSHPEPDHKQHHQSRATCLDDQGGTCPDPRPPTVRPVKKGQRRSRRFLARQERALQPVAPQVLGTCFSTFGRNCELTFRQT
ncbi:hypothetical protein AVEN_116194-1 [Araneus ventricosus]|uniref:Uncharacterized protein n=1 Tax=Araneus ventricosus TaxID=182803 RepID=A0A4Y2Q6T5_ARAVE|nr:hypothetical protein AVEN_116194-1 [Araneus ventricosus]